VAYTSEGIAALVKKPQNRIKAVTPVIECLGGKVIGGGVCFGDYDIALMVSLPDNASAAAAAMTFGAGGALKAMKTTPLLSASEAVYKARFSVEIQVADEIGRQTGWPREGLLAPNDVAFP